MRIFHLAEPEDWQARTDIYSAASLESEGFIHCSTKEQLATVYERHFAGRSDLTLLEIDTTGLEERVVYEDLYGLGEEYPHIYGVVPIDAIKSSGWYIPG